MASYDHVAGTFCQALDVGRRLVSSYSVRSLCIRGYGARLSAADWGCHRGGSHRGAGRAGVLVRLHGVPVRNPPKLLMPVFVLFGVQGCRGTGSSLSLAWLTNSYVPPCFTHLFCNTGVTGVVVPGTWPWREEVGGRQKYMEVIFNNSGQSGESGESGAGEVVGEAAAAQNGGGHVGRESDQKV